MSGDDKIEVPDILKYKSQPQPLRDEDTPEGTFDLSFRVMNNEVLGFAMRVDDFKMKWIIVGLAAVGVLAWVAVTFGPMITQTFGG
tara:strand:- start:8886 stop:9143 length:258 start_codon:yes stop_codon:yes gene_type:complete